MTLVFDTSVLIDLENRSAKTVEEIKKLSESHPVPARITFINYFEFIHGIRKRNPANIEEAVSFIEIFTMLQPTKDSAKILSSLKSKYDKKGKTLPISDFLIAAQAIENNMVLITKDKDFGIIEELDKVIL